MDFDTALDSKIVRYMDGINIKATLGGDPEFFIEDAKGTILNADRFFPGKENPVLIAAKGEMKSKLFFDGIQGEIAPAHSACREYLTNNIWQCFNRIYNSIPEDHKMVLVPSAKINKKIIENADPEARIFGCMPDFNAYTLSVNTTEMDASTHPYRYAGGHMHFGISSPYQKKGMPEFDLAKREEGHIRAVKFMDLLVSIPTLILDNGPGSKLRRDKYGKAGCFRPTPYGIEYRTPSCWWLKSPMLASLVYGLGRLAWTMMVRGVDEDLRKAVGFDDESIRGAIDESDEPMAYKIWEHMRPYVALSGAAISNPLHITSSSSTKYDDIFAYRKNVMPKHKGRVVYTLAVFEYMLNNGIESVIKPNVKSEWCVGDPDQWRNTRGFVVGSFQGLRNNKDFMKFQERFLKEKVYTKA